MTTTDQFNEIIQNINNGVYCGTTCKSQNTTNDLYETYMKAKANMNTAPEKFEEAEKNWYINKYGENEYNDYIRGKYQEQATKRIEDYKTSFYKYKNDIEKAIAELSIINTGTKNTEILYNDVNQSLETTTAINNEYNTNYRMVYYQQGQVINTIARYNTFLVIYYVLVVVFSLSLFLIKKEMKLAVKLVLIFIVFVYPILIPQITKMIKNNLHNLQNKIPTTNNVSTVASQPQ